MCLYFYKDSLSVKRLIFFAIEQNIFQLQLFKFLTIINYYIYKYFIFLKKLFRLKIDN